MSDLLELTTELVGIPSVSHDESAMADRVVELLGSCEWLEMERIENNVVARTSLGRDRRVVLAGHLDTVAAAGNASPRRQGDVLYGVGSADMKSGLAVMIDLARSLPEPAMDVTWCFYACEEVARRESGLEVLWTKRPELLAGDAAVLGEPTSNQVEAGCQGTMRAVVELGGVRAHTARPFTGVNAIHRMVPVLDRVAGWPGRSVVLEGCEYVEQLQAVGIEGGVANNVVPDRATIKLNYRFAPDRDHIQARAFLDALLGDLLDPDAGDSIEIVDEADGAPPQLEHPVLSTLVASTGEAPRAKVGWTDVASFWEHGVPAANFGPGDPLLAHHPDEHIDRAALERARTVLQRLLSLSV